MRALSPQAQERSDVKILAVSKERVEVLSPIPILVGTLLQLHLPAENRFVLGEAQYCDATGASFQVGIEIEDSYPRPQAEGSPWVISPKC